MDELSQQLYQNYMSQFKGTTGGSARRFSKRNLRWLKSRLLPLLAGVSRRGRILEVGCGGGQLLGFLAGEGFTGCFGVDIGSEQVALARLAGLDVRHGDLIHELQQFHHEIDAIIAVDVLEHISRERLLEFGQCCLRAIRPGGVILLQTPNGEGLHSGHVIYGDLTHRTIFSESSITQYLKLVGFVGVTVHEAGPCPCSVVGAVQWVVWMATRTVSAFVIMAETGRWPRVLTQNLLCLAYAPASGAEDTIPSTR